MDTQDKKKTSEQMEEWERIHREESGISLSERKSNQLSKLGRIIGSLYDYFGQNLVAVTKQVRGEALTEEETGNLRLIEDRVELSDRVKGLIKGFGKDYYQALESVTGVKFSLITTKKQEDSEEHQTATEESDTENGRTSRLPKGFNKWDLKMIKLHESRPSDNKRIWVEFWTLKGITSTGEILYNPTKDLFYFKPYKTGTHTFALTDEHGRKATAQARNYYFRVSPNPPIVEQSPPAG